MCVCVCVCVELAPKCSAKCCWVELGEGREKERPLWYFTDYGTSCNMVHHINIVLHVLWYFTYYGTICTVVLHILRYFMYYGTSCTMVLHVSHFVPRPPTHHPPTLLTTHISMT